MGKPTIGDLLHNNGLSASSTSFDINKAKQDFERDRFSTNINSHYVKYREKYSQDIMVSIYGPTKIKTNSEYYDTTPVKAKTIMLVHGFSKDLGNRYYTPTRAILLGVFCPEGFDEDQVIDFGNLINTWYWESTNADYQSTFSVSKRIKDQFNLIFPRKLKKPMIRVDFCRVTHDSILDQHFNDIYAILRRIGQFGNILDVHAKNSLFKNFKEWKYKERT